MTSAALAQRLDGRPSGRGRWQAHCPAHQDRSPSLSIREGNDGRTLVRCWAGCTTKAVMQAAGLHIRDLFSGPPPTAAQARQAEEERERREAKARERRRRRGLLADRYRVLNDLICAIGPLLMEIEDTSEADAMTSVYHAAVNKIHIIGAFYERQEAQGFHRRLIRFCEKNHIDYQRLLAQYLPEVKKPDQGTKEVPGQ